MVLNEHTIVHMFVCWLSLSFWIGCWYLQNRCAKIICRCVVCVCERVFFTLIKLADRWKGDREKCFVHACDSIVESALQTLFIAVVVWHTWALRFCLFLRFFNFMLCFLTSERWKMNEIHNSQNLYKFVSIFRRWFCCAGAVSS